MNWTALGLSPAAGRIAVREPSASERLEMLNELIALRGGTWDAGLYKKILLRSKLLAIKRNILAHGIWGFVHDRDEWHVQLARGSWPKDLSDLVRGSKKVTPEGVVMDVDKLRSAANDIEELISGLERLRSSAAGPAKSSLETPA